MYSVRNLGTNPDEKIKTWVFLSPQHAELLQRLARMQQDIDAQKFRNMKPTAPVPRTVQQWVFGDVGHAAMLDVAEKCRQDKSLDFTKTLEAAFNEWCAEKTERGATTAFLRNRFSIPRSAGRVLEQLLEQQGERMLESLTEEFAHV